MAYKPQIKWNVERNKKKTTTKNCFHGPKNKTKKIIVNYNEDKKKRSQNKQRLSKIHNFLILPIEYPSQKKKNYWAPKLFYPNLNKLTWFWFETLLIIFSFCLCCWHTNKIGWRWNFESRLFRYYNFVFSLNWKRVGMKMICFSLSSIYAHTFSGRKKGIILYFLLHTDLQKKKKKNIYNNIRDPVRFMYYSVLRLFCKLRTFFFYIFNETQFLFFFHVDFNWFDYYIAFTFDSVYN